MSTTTDFLIHTTSDGDRWDQLAWRYYGDPTLMEAIITANPQAPIAPILEGGLQLAIPVLDDTEAIATEDLPPWKR